MSQGLPVVEMPEPLGLFAGQLFDRANQYLAAYEKLAAINSMELPYPTHFLLQHAVELYLKAFLAAKGTSKKALRKYGHGLNELLEVCDRMGVSRATEFGYLVRDLHENSRDHDFRYPTNYNLRAPSPRLVAETLHPFRDRIEPVITSARVVAELEHHASTQHLKGKAKIRWSD